MCSLYHSLVQKSYLAGIRQEFAEQDRINIDISKHVEKCAACNGLDPDSLVKSIFGENVVVLKNDTLPNV